MAIPVMTQCRYLIYDDMSDVVARPELSDLQVALRTLLLGLVIHPNTFWTNRCDGDGEGLFRLMLNYSVNQFRELWLITVATIDQQEVIVNYSDQFAVMQGVVCKPFVAISLADPGLVGKLQSILDEVFEESARFIEHWTFKIERVQVSK